MCLSMSLGVVAHFHIAMLKPSAFNESVEKLGDFLSAMCQAYSQTTPSVVQTVTFKRRLLLSYGREMITGVSMYPYFDEDSVSRVRIAGVRGIRTVSFEKIAPHVEAPGEEPEALLLRKALCELGFS